MKKRIYQALLPLLACLFMITASGCNSAQTNAAGGQASPPASAPSEAPASSAASDAPPSTESTESPSPHALVSESPEPETECNWTLEVADTQTAKVNGYDFTCTLSIMAVKLGGTDELGAYRGIVTLDYEYDMKQGNVSGNASGGGQEIDAIIEVVPYDEQKYDESAGQTQVAQLVEFDAMALGNLILTGSGEADEAAGGASWATADSKTIPVPYRLTVDGGQVTIELINVAPGVLFKGMITGTPI